MAVGAWTAVGHNRDAQSCWVYSCGIDQWTTSADVEDVEKLEGRTVVFEEFGAGVAFGP